MLDIACLPHWGFSGLFGQGFGGLGFDSDA